MVLAESLDESAGIADFKALQGVWRSRGYGKVLLIEPDEYTLFEETAISCQETFTGSLDELALYYDDLRVSPGEQTFSAHRVTGVARIHFRRLKALPPTAAATRMHEARDPVFNFEVFWRTFDEHYALFDLKGVDWHESYQRFRPKVHRRSSREALFSNLAAMLRPLRDGHIRLHSPWGHFSAGALPSLYNRLERELEASSDGRELATYLDDLKAWLREVIHEEYLMKGVEHGAARLMEWGRLGPSTGYLNIRAMAGLCGRIGHPADDIRVTDRVMQQVLADLGGLPNLVVDIRTNGGGYDGVALRIAAYLLDRKRLAFSKYARKVTGFTGKQPVYVDPAGSGSYRGNLYLLTSELTASAAEIFVLSLLQRPGLTLIGDPTHGILSDTLERHLPNGWHFTLSNEVYEAFDGQVYEDTGIPPHIRLPFLGRRGREDGKDPMLERVLKEVSA
ncbi:S41 family peptidase [Marinobacter nanhaiticus D15-8W]|uniref:Tail specific protease domain-containing protein n=1 Tax=Marinobacter nanhaiticus D15-8W TaxID=626887 RepID=N6W7U3_9GAMM|nr:S41 family peptidase [Marinobacter nanhaiticus]ENO16314.1 hypothetical protein J057_13196 [Marinobacter nanhaiticus D15-8W]BES72827.1 S41 family peptidase [Marinobacter nanhaiticus D15-8W]